MTIKRAIAIAACAACAVVLVFVALVLALFRGYFDSGLFEVKESCQSSNGRVALVGKRSDHQAMSSDQYFVLVEDHLLTPRELRAALHSNRVVFSASDDCVGVRWRDAENLTVLCRGGTIDRGHINVQRSRVKGVTISYEDIPAVTPES